MNKLKYHSISIKFCRYFQKWKIKFINENYDGHNCLIKKYHVYFAINGIEHDISLRMLTF